MFKTIGSAVGTCLRPPVAAKAHAGKVHKPHNGTFSRTLCVSPLWHGLLMRMML